ncbi:unnamed protein product [Paramecium sonneborni]|uniref:Uncharacterized protein n=1 Tax=Paramecium sonneborni TaxID=65129 RepID=A0A8S1RDD6_9CILI|nr:unnamed protein product [Paramecium sonneborni]
MNPINTKLKLVYIIEIKPIKETISKYGTNIEYLLYIILT